MTKKLSWPFQQCLNTLNISSDLETFCLSVSETGCLPTITWHRREFQSVRNRLASGYANLNLSSNTISSSLHRHSHIYIYLPLPIFFSTPDSSLSFPPSRQAGSWKLILPCLFEIFSQSLSFDISLERGKLLFLMRCWRGGLKVGPGKSAAVLLEISEYFMLL